jgi:hypothetical protein
VRDDHVIDTCDKYGIAMAFTGVRLFHHWFYIYDTRRRRYQPGNS